MQGLVVLWLIINSLLYFPLFIIIWSLNYGLPSALSPENPGNGLWYNRGLRTIGVARFEKLYQLYDEDFKDRTIFVIVIACVLQFVGIFIIMLAIALGEPMNFIPEIEEISYMGFMYDFFMFALNVQFIHLLPMIVHILVLLYRIPLPFSAELKRNRAQERNEITRWEKDSEGLAWIRLTRFENSEKAFIYANCCSERSKEAFKLVLCQGKKTGDRAQCFLYSDDESTLEQINPAPVSVNELDEIFLSDDESTSEQTDPVPISARERIFSTDDEETSKQINPASVSFNELNEIFNPEDESTLEHINPTRVTSDELDKIFIPDDDEVTE